MTGWLAFAILAALILAPTVQTGARRYGPRARIGCRLGCLSLSAPLAVAAVAAMLLTVKP